MLGSELRLLLAEFGAALTSFTSIHACLFDREWLNPHVRPVDYQGYACALADISATLERLCGKAAHLSGEPENLTTFRDYFGALLPFLDASRECVRGLEAYCVAMNSLGAGTENSVAEAQRVKDLYVGLGLRMHSARKAYRAASARWGFGLSGP